MLLEEINILQYCNNTDTLVQFAYLVHLIIFWQFYTWACRMAYVIGNQHWLGRQPIFLLVGSPRRNTL